ncbi:hypothetical protein D3C72_2258970 [compost metagenome]
MEYVCNFVAQLSVGNVLGSFNIIENIESAFFPWRGSEPDLRKGVNQQLRKLEQIIGLSGIPRLPDHAILSDESAIHDRIDEGERRLSYIIRMGDSNNEMD